MRIIEGISATRSQSFELRSENNEPFRLTLVYHASVRMWTINVVFDNREIMGITVSAGPHDILGQYKNILPFGLMCVSPYQADPKNLADFSVGQYSLAILDGADRQGLDRLWIEIKESIEQG